MYVELEEQFLKGGGGGGILLISYLQYSPVVTLVVLQQFTPPFM